MVVSLCFKLAVLVAAIVREDLGKLQWTSGDGGRMVRLRVVVQCDLLPLSLCLCLSHTMALVGVEPAQCSMRDEFASVNF
ncbi:hypothetical protein BKA67DRAFT_376072 [Truncatella angustata]|uniref:Secreted protein n=1 Tax=Truncatella angustata TaxID=152316 RepID=A0A9P8ZU58_9PEZI|nr:uncharacterized protein BKA67DRAFT_376072 [Truncatella angustata]KAH6648892.1 hypothetical protein BKA67DRAFT_376072 [Truncatella angustata]